MDAKQLNLGEVMSSLRQYKGLTFEELAEGVCSLEDIMLFEANEKYPTIEQLYQIAEKLNVAINYFFDLTISGDFDYSINVINLIEKYKRKRNYAEIYHIIQTEKNNPIFLNTTNKQYLLWHEGICTFYLKKNKIKAFTILNQALDLTNPKRNNFSEREIEILTSIAIIEKDDLNYRTSLQGFTEAYQFLKKLPHIINPKVTLKVLYALSQLLTRMGRYNDSLKYCLEGIDICRNYDQLYLFGELHYQAGENLIRHGDKLKGKEFLNKAIYIFELQKNEEYIELVQKEIENLPI